MRMCMHGWRAGGEDDDDDESKRERRRHMWTDAPPHASPILAALPHSDADASPSSPSSSSNSASFFSKDGRKISVGDCALFKPPQDSPPFIGIIRCLTTGKENKLRLRVNWLYRPSEVKLGKGFLLEAAPNEIFYSFHKDEIPAASLLHPCKVAFLPKGVELPTGIGSFVCRKVYDITNKCLWWLTDQDYINERQEEVNHLLYKTRIEMHAAVPPGGRSPKSTNGPTSTSQLKPGSDSLQNSASFSSQVKGKKRERGDQVSESVKRERSSKMEDGDAGHYRTESSLKSEIAKISEKGGLVDYEGVEKLVQLMLPERNEKKIDLVCRSMLAGVVAVTDNFDCLNRFVQLRGLPVFDEWLQEVHKGKIGDASSPKDGDKSVEEFLLILLHALDKLPVNLHALQMCNIGKSVNHLRTHKNLEIQKKARGLVDTWKKRVEADLDAKSGSNQAVSWSARPRLPEVPHSGNRQTGGSSEVATKSLVMQPAAPKATSVKLVQGETATKSAFASPVSMKSAPLAASVTTNLKDGQPRNAGGGASDLPSTPAKDEKSSSSSQSHNNSQSCSSDHTKAGGFSGKEDARSSTAVSMTVSKTSGSSSRSRKSANGFPGTTPTGVQRETGLNRSSSWQRNPATERLAQSSLTSEKALDVPVVDGSNHKLIVKITNRGRSPAQNVNGGSFEDTSLTNSRASSPVFSDKQDQSDCNTKEKIDAFRANISSSVNTESWQINDIKDAVAGSDEGDRSPAVFPDEKGCRTGDDTRKVVEISKGVSISSGIQSKAVKFHEASLSSIHALLESCAKYSEANVSVPVGDDIGMNLLASVAAGEMSKSDIVSPTGSPQRNTSSNEHLCDDNDSRVKSFPRAEFSQVQSHSTDGADENNEKQKIDHKLWAKNADSKKEKPSRDLTGQLDHSPMDLQHTVDPCIESNGNLKEKITGKDTKDGAAKDHEEKTSSRVDADGIQDAKQNMSGSLMTEDRVSESDVKVENGTVEGSSSNRSSETDDENKKKINEGVNSVMQTDQNPPPTIVHSEFVRGTGEEVVLSSGPGKDMDSENVDVVKSERVNEADVSSHVNHREKQKVEGRSNAPMTHGDRAVLLVSAVTSQKDEHMEENLEANDVKEEQCTGLTPDASPVLQVQETGRNLRPGGGKLTGSEGNEVEESASTTVDASFSAVDMEAKVEFDLNEGFTVDDGKYGESNNLAALGCSTAVQQMISPLPFPVSSVSSSLPASITVAAAAKGPFVPPEDLLRSKGALGWKGSAATSAFRPAEPRKVLEMQLGATSSPLSDATPGNQNRPPLDIDLNVPDERIFEDLASRSSAQDTVSISASINNCDVSRGELGPTPIRCSGGLDLDLNRVEEHTDIGNYSTSNGHRTDVPLKSVTSSSGGLFNGQVSVRRDFDLNDGPVVDEMSAEPLLFNQHTRSVPSQPPVASLRMNNAETGNFSSWFPRGNTYSTITVPSVLSDRGEHPFPIVASGGPQRMLAPPTGGSPFGPDVYRGSVLSSSPAMPFPTTPFQYPVFPFGTSFLSPATFSGGSTAYMDSSSGGRVCFPAVNSQLIGPAGAVPSHYPRPYVVSLPDGSNSASAESSWKWGRQGLDLNAGPGVPDIEGRDETSPLVPRQLSVAGSQALAEEQARMYQMAGGVLKRKEPEGGWDGYNRPSWR